MRNCTLLFSILVLSSLVFSAFSDIIVSPNTTSAYVQWKTDDSCSAKIFFGKNTSYGSTATNSTVSLTHGIKMSSLVTNTQYHFKLQCKVNSSYSYNSTDQSFTTIEALPDLYIKSITITPNSTTLDKNVTVKVYVGNSGNAKASNVTLDIVCPDGSVLHKSTSSISVGSSSSISGTCPPPSQPGSATVSVVAGGMTDANPHDNEGSASLTYSQAPMPDLEITPGDITYYLSDTSGTTYVVFHILVMNKGTASASNVNVSIANVTKKISSISAGSSASFSVTIPLASRTSFIIKADPANTIIESDETNNMVDFQISTQSTLPDIIVQQSLITNNPKSPKTGSTVVISATIKNNGTTTARNFHVIFQKAEKVFIYDKEGDKTQEKESGVFANLGILLEDQKAKQFEGASVKGEIFSDVTVSSLAPGASTTVKGTIIMPPNTNSMLIAVTADPKNKIQETDKSNNMALHPMDIEVVYPDILVLPNEITISPPDPVPSTMISLRAKIRNNGSLVAKNVSVKLSVSTDGSPYSSAGTTIVPTISAGGNSLAAINWTIPSGAKSITVKVEANPAKTITELNYSNNNASRMFNMSLPDLVLLNLTSTGTVSVGNQVTLKATATNIGTESVTDAVVEFYYMKPDGSLTLIGSKTSTISPGSKPVLSLQWTIPSGISTNPVVIARINPQHTVFESDFSNNEETLALNAALPDIIILLSTSPQTVPIPTTSDRRNYVYVNANVRNQGNARADNILVRIMKWDGTVMYEQTIGSLYPGENWTLTTYLPITNQFGTGDLSFSAVADPLGTITEIRDDNNEAETSVHLVPNNPPDAVISSDKTDVLKNEWIEFDCYNSTDPEDGHYVSCEWLFDNQYHDSGSDVIRNFDTSGSHLVTLTVTDSDGAKDTAIGIIHVADNQPPVVDLGDSMTIYVNEPSDFTPLTAYDPDGSIVSLTWNFGDSHTDSGGSVTHTYTSTGTYTMTATATDDSGASYSDSVTVYVTTAPAMTTKQGTEYFYSHHAHYEYGPKADVFYGYYKVDYQVTYTTNDRIIRSVSYTVTPGAAIVTAVSDADAESYWMDMTAIASNGYTAMQVTGFNILVGGGGNLGGATGGKHISHTETDRTMSYSGLDIQMPSNKDVYVDVESDIEFPGVMCDPSSPCQHQAAAWKIG